MSVTIPLGPRTWSHSTDKEGVRTYRVTFRVELSSTLVGPNEIRQAPGLPRPGDVWAFENVPDFWAWCTWEREVSPIQKREGSPTYFADVTCVFSSKAPKKCQDEKFDDPLLELPEVSGGSVRYNEEATIDRFGQPIRNSSWEVLKGPSVQFDANRPTIKIKMNVATFAQVALAYTMQDHLNSVPMWGRPERTIKLSGVNFEKKYFGLCHAYYSLDLEFDVGNSQHGGRPGSTTFDRDVADEGTKVLKGHWNVTTHEWVLDQINGTDPDPSDPRHFIRLADVPGNITKCILDGAGKPFDPGNQVVSDCPECPTGYRYMRVSGFLQPGLNASMEHTTGCNWEGFGTINGQPYLQTLSYDPYTDNLSTVQHRWKFESSYYPMTTWYLTPGETASFGGSNAYSWACKGPNTMINTSTGALTEPGPSKLVIFPGGGNQPGNIHIEKYPDANLLLLGVPLIL